MLAKITSLEGGSHGSIDDDTCKKCGMDAHTGGLENCPLKGLSDTEARKKRVAQVIDAMAKLSPEDVVAKFLANDSSRE